LVADARLGVDDGPFNALIVDYQQVILYATLPGKDG
jgi:hypothetical protein